MYLGLLFLHHRTYMLGCVSLMATLKGWKGEGVFWDVAEPQGRRMGTRCWTLSSPLITWSYSLLSIQALCPGNCPHFE